MAKRIVLSVAGMECPNCAMKLESMEDKLPGVLRAEASYRKGELVVEFNEQVTGVEQISAEVERLGFQVVPSSPAKK